MASGSATPSSALATESSAPEVPPLPPKLRPKPQRKGNVGAGKRYADEVAFAADVTAWERERDERKVLVKERERTLDQQRDRSNRNRDGEHETDSERRVRQRQESQPAMQAHAERQAAQRVSSRLEEQRTWAGHVQALAAIFDCAQPSSFPSTRTHPFAYTADWDVGLGNWFRDGEQIHSLAAFIRSNPPTGEEAWELDVDDCAFDLWKPGQRGTVRNGRLHMLGAGYARLLCLPSVPPKLAAILKPHMDAYVAERQRDSRIASENDKLAKQGFPPVPGWEPMVEVGYMAKPIFYDLPADEIRRRCALAALQTAFRAEKLGPFDHYNDRTSRFWKGIEGAEDACTCNYKHCRCDIGLVLDANMNPVTPLKAARLENC